MGDTDDILVLIRSAASHHVAGCGALIQTGHKSGIIVTLRHVWVEATTGGERSVGIEYPLFKFRPPHRSIAQLAPDEDGDLPEELVFLVAEAAPDVGAVGQLTSTKHPEVGPGHAVVGMRTGGSVAPIVITGTITGVIEKRSFDFEMRDSYLLDKCWSGSPVFVEGMLAGIINARDVRGRSSVSYCRLPVVPSTIIRSHFERLPKRSYKVRAKATAETRASEEPEEIHEAPKTGIGKAIVLNRDAIVLSADSLLLLLDEKIASLRSERLNSEEAAREIERFEDMRRALEGFRGAALTFTAGKSGERPAVESAETFAGGVSAWWTKDHQKICNSAFTMSLFLTGVSICSLAGAGGSLSAVIVGTLVGGKPIADAIKAFRGKRS
jgi:hypothetical protein